MQDHLVRVLAFDNPWMTGADRDAWLAVQLPARFVPRRVRLVADERVALVVGPRQVGKSTLVWKTLAETGRRPLLLDCEVPAVREWLRSPAAFLADLDEHLPGVDALFFEEVQRLPAAGLFLKGVADRRTGRHVFATGSSSFDLEDATRESLAGRALRHLLLPFALAEVRALVAAPALVAQVRARAQLDRLLVFGGYPTVWTGARPEEDLAALVEAFVVRDASDRFRVRHLAAFRKVLQLLARQVGSLCNFSEWAALAGIGNDTVAEYVELLEQTHIVRLVRPFAGGKRAEITTTPKVFFVDNGVRNALAGGFAPFESRTDRGALLEGFVFAELSKIANPLLDSIRFWRSKSGAEVDFVLEHQGRLLACEVKSGDERGRLTRSARSFIDAYAPEVLLVVSPAPHAAHAARQEGATEVRFVTPADVAAEAGRFLGG